MRAVLDFYNSTFGVENRQRAVTAVFRPGVSREGQGGYFRKGYFVLPKLKDPDAALPSIAHELAHYWFIHAGQQHAWLNESFAEYSAMMAMRRLRGPQEFERILEEKRKRVASASLPPIYQFDRTKNRRAAPAVMYVKGPLALRALEQEIGSSRFISLLRRMIHDNVIDTDQMIALVRELSSERVATDFLQLLKV
jgi:aminopeptidase N